MSNKSELWNMMQVPLPSISEQKRLMYKPTKAEAVAIYKLINATVFDNQLSMPVIEIKARCMKYWGMCFCEYTKIKYRNTHCRIRLMDKWYCRQWLITILAHEMCHQYQWDIRGNERVSEGKERIISHGPSFFIFRDKLAEHGISLKKWHRRNKWFKHQTFR